VRRAHVGSVRSRGPVLSCRQGISDGRAGGACTRDGRASSCARSPGAPSRPIRKDVADLKAIFALNGSGSGSGSSSTARGLDGVLAELVERFDVPIEEASADLSAFVARLLAAGLVERKG